MLPSDSASSEAWARTVRSLWAYLVPAAEPKAEDQEPATNASAPCVSPSSVAAASVAGASVAGVSSTARSALRVMASSRSGAGTAAVGCSDAFRLRAKAPEVARRATETAAGATRVRMSCERVRTERRGAERKAAALPSGSRVAFTSETRRGWYIWCLRYCLKLRTMTKLAEIFSGTNPICPPSLELPPVAEGRRPPRHLL